MPASPMSPEDRLARCRKAILAVTEGLPGGAMGHEVRRLLERIEEDLAEIETLIRIENDRR